MNCPFCATHWRDLISLATHVQVVHDDQPMPHLTTAQVSTPTGIKLQVAGTVDMDAIYLRRPDLIKPRSAP